MLSFVFTAGAIQLDQDISTFTTTGFDLSITVTDGKSTTGPAILTVIIRGIYVFKCKVLTNTCTLCFSKMISHSHEEIR